MGIKISLSYDTWNDEDIEIGETDNRGFEIEDKEFEFRDLIRLIENYGIFGNSNSGYYVTDQPELNYRTFTQTNRALHFADIPRKRKYFDLAWKMAIK